MQLTPDLWNVLHDGRVRAVSGVVPGDVQLDVEIDYLRRRFPEPGDRFLLTLHYCTALSYQPDGCETPQTEFASIAENTPVILRAEGWTNATEVYCAAGTLRVQAVGFSMALNGDRTVGFEELWVVITVMLIA